MYIKASLFICMLCCLFSCSYDKSIADFKTKKEFLDYVEHLSLDRQQSYLSSLANTLEDAISKVDENEIYFSFSFGISDANQKEVNWDTVDWNNQNIESSSFLVRDKDSTLRYVDRLKNTLYYSQQYMLPNSDFDIGSEEFELDNNLQTENIAFYKNDKLIEGNKIGIQAITKIKSKLKYNIVNSYDSVIINNKFKESSFHNYIIKIDTISEQGLEIEIPIALYDKLLGNRGKTPNNRLITTNSYSATPIFGFRPDYQEETKKVIEILKRLATQTDSKKIMDELAINLDESMFIAAKSTIIFQEKISKDLLKLLNNDEDVFEQIKKIRTFIENNIEYIKPVKQQIAINYPYAVKDFIFYFADSTELLEQHIFIPVKRDSHNATEVFYDRDRNTFGIIDSSGKIVIDATYRNLKASYSPNYFFDDTDSLEYYLNNKDKKLEPVKKGFRIMDVFGDLSISINKDDKYGVFKQDKEIIPSKYKNIQVIDSLIIATRTLRGRDVIDLHNAKGELHEIPTIIREVSKAGKNMIVRNNQHKYGMINKKGELVFPMVYDEIQKTATDKNFLATIGKKYFILTDKGQKIDFPLGNIYPNPAYLGDDLFGYQDPDIYLYGFFDNNKIVIKPQYIKITPFLNGKAMVKTKDNDVLLIDKNNKVLKIITKNTDEDLDTYLTDDNKILYYLGDVKYDANGDISNLPIN